MINLKIKIGLLIFSIIFTFFVGSFFSFFVDMNIYKDLNVLIKVPSFIFPVVWSIIYLLLGTSLYLVLVSNCDKKQAIKYYLIQLFINSVWTLVFFGFSLYVVSFILIVLLIFFVILMIISFYKINKVAGLLNIFYLLWLLFAGLLNLSIIILK